VSEKSLPLVVGLVLVVIGFSGILDYDCDLGEREVAAEAGKPGRNSIRTTFQISDPAPLILNCQPEPHRRVR
jgi:hypothetical protein